MPYFWKASFLSHDSIPVVGVLCDKDHTSEFGDRPLILLNHTDSCNLNVKGGVFFEDETPKGEARFKVICKIGKDVPLQNGDIVRLDPRANRIICLYKQGANSNAIFLTERCNCNCIMCPQPPKNDSIVRLAELLEFIKCLPDQLEELAITGGEPTVCRDEFLTVLEALKKINCGHIHVLSNARLLSESAYVDEITSLCMQNLTFGVPLYASNPTFHDYIVQSRGAFDQTVDGIFNLARNNVPVEIRTVIHKQTYQGLLSLAEFVYFNLPFIYHYALMGMEHMGYVKKNWDLLWINPLEYQNELLKTIQYLYRRGVNTSIYNLPLCLLDKKLWPFARKSISDFKETFTDACNSCSVKSECSGLFKFQARVMPIMPM